MLDIMKKLSQNVLDWILSVTPEPVVFNIFEIGAKMNLNVQGISSDTAKIFHGEHFMVFKVKGSETTITWIPEFNFRKFVAPFGPFDNESMVVFKPVLNAEGDHTYFANAIFANIGVVSVEVLFPEAIIELPLPKWAAPEQESKLYFASDAVEMIPTFIEELNNLRAFQLKEMKELAMTPTMEEIILWSQGKKIPAAKMFKKRVEKFGADLVEVVAALKKSVASSEK